MFLIVSVYHNVDSLFMEYRPEDRARMVGMATVPVELADGEDRSTLDPQLCEAVFEALNDNGYQNARFPAALVAMRVNYQGGRSLSVGDLVVISAPYQFADNTDVAAYAVAICGFTRVDWERVHLY